MKKAMLFVTERNGLTDIVNFSFKHTEDPKQEYFKLRENQYLKRGIDLPIEIVVDHYVRG